MHQKRYNGVSKLDWLFGFLLFLLAAAVMGWRLGEPGFHVFDESYYVPAGEAFFNLDKWTNNSHPPLGKWIIGASIALFDGQPFAWRLPGLIMGCLTIVSVFAIIRLFGLGMTYAVFAAIMTLMNQTLLVQTRTAMLDIYTIGFFSLAMWALIWSAKRSRSKEASSLALVLSGVLLGLSVASKWSGGFYMVLVWAGIFIWRCTESSPKGYVLPRLFGTGFAGWNKLSLVGAGIRQLIPAILVYLLSFLPFLFMEGDWSIAQLHQMMFKDVASYLKPHPYQSEWWEWPLMLEPMWYYFEAIKDASGEDSGFRQAVFHIGNPAIYWGGSAAILACFGFGLKRSDGVLLAVSGGFFAFWLFYAILPRAILFSFYFEQAAIMFGMAIAVFIERIVPDRMRVLVGGIWFAAAIGLFIYFYPVLTAIPFEGGTWLRWVWFPFWT